VGCAPGVVVVGSGGMLQVGFPGVDKPAGGVVGHPFAARGAMECYDRCGRSGSIRGGDLARDGGHDLHDPRPTAVVGDHAPRRSRQRMCPSRSP
jgi:hypothetical protein